jgi:hypothetical protein
MFSLRSAPSHTSQDGRDGAEGESAQPAASRTDTIVGLGIAGFALYFWAIAILMSVAPKFFFAHIGPFGVLNEHYIRDTATFSAAFAAGLTVAYRRMSWRVPLLFCVTVQFALHSINHLVDIDAAHPRWLGPADFISLTLAAIMLTVLLARALRPPAKPSVAP